MFHWDLAFGISDEYHFTRRHLVREAEESAMKLGVRTKWVQLICLSVFATGCAGKSDRLKISHVANDPRTPSHPKAPEPEFSVQFASARVDGTAPSLAAHKSEAANVWPAELTADSVVEQVLARNPSLEQMVAAWQGASARYPQVTSMDDPVFGSTLAPAGVGQLENGNRGYRLDISQKIPWKGKLDLRGKNALAEADAAGRDVEDTRQQLIESARIAFSEYYLVARALEVNAESLRLLKEFRENAEARYKTGMLPQQDILQADVEIGRQRERQVTLDRMREVAVARINTLAHFPPGAPLPPPPKELRPSGTIPDVQSLLATAQSRRPDLEALASRIAAEQASVALASKEFYPDVELMAAYDTFWAEKEQRAQVGLRMNLPIRVSRRQGAVAQSQARLIQRRAEFGRLQDDINFQVQDAASQIRESERVVKLYEKEILPAAEANVKSAQSAYVTGKLPFLSLIEAQRNVATLRDRNYEAISGYFRRLAHLERAVGGSVDLARPLSGK